MLHGFVAFQWNKYNFDQKTWFNKTWKRIKLKWIIKRSHFPLENISYRRYRLQWKKIYFCNDCIFCGRKNLRHVNKLEKGTHLFEFATLIEKISLIKHANATMLIKYGINRWGNGKQKKTYITLLLRSKLTFKRAHANSSGSSNRQRYESRS